MFTQIRPDVNENLKCTWLTLHHLVSCIHAKLRPLHSVECWLSSRKAVMRSSLGLILFIIRVSWLLSCKSCQCILVILLVKVHLISTYTMSSIHYIKYMCIPKSLKYSLDDLNAWSSVSPYIIDIFQLCNCDRRPKSSLSAWWKFLWRRNKI